jgi:pyruvate/2-oxoglutarate/acetoin dehydrogenase E1 component
MELTFTQYVNKKIHEKFASYNHSVIFGQNIVSGSRISGLGAGLDQIENCVALNTTNSENSLMGLGFGLALSEIPSLFLMKQHDFALLGLDQLTNTYNVLRNGRLKAPFIVLMVVVDSGFEGPQASLSSLDEFASLTRAPIYFLSSKENIDKAFELTSEPGLHLMALSQKNMKSFCTSSQEVFMECGDAIIYRYIPNSKNAKIAVVSFGVNILVAKEVAAELSKEPYSVSLVSMNKLVKIDLSSELFSEIVQHEKIVVIDSGKSEIHFSSDLALSLKKYGKETHLYQRTSSQKWSVVSDDALEFDVQSIIQKVLRGTNIG